MAVNNEVILSWTFLKKVEPDKAMKEILVEGEEILQCYQTVRNWSGYKLGLVGADEIHDSISPENAKFYFNNAFQGILGLTAKFDGSKYYDFSNNKQIFNFSQIYNTLKTFSFIFSKSPTCIKHINFPFN